MGRYTCQWGSNTGSADSQPAVARCWLWRGPQPSRGVTENAHCADATLERRSPGQPPSSAINAPGVRAYADYISIYAQQSNSIVLK